MFNSNNNLKFIVLNDLDASSIIDMKYMFDTCSSLEYLKLNNINISSAIDMSYMSMSNWN